MCRTCLGSVTFSCCSNLTQSHTMLPWCTLPPGPPRHRHGWALRTRDVDTATCARRRCSENESAWMSGNGGHRYHDMVSIL